MHNAVMTDGLLERRHITAREAQDCLGIPASTIRGWASKQLLYAVSIDTNGERWYLLAAVLELREATRRRTRHARPNRRPTARTA